MRRRTGAGTTPRASRADWQERIAPRMGREEEDSEGESEEEEKEELGREEEEEGCSDWASASVAVAIWSRRVSMAAGSASRRRRTAATTWPVGSAGSPVWKTRRAESQGAVPGRVWRSRV